MLIRLKMWRLFLKLATYLLPLFSFEIGWKIWAHTAQLSGRPANYQFHGHNALILLSTFVWAAMAEHYNVTSIEELFRERTGVRAAWSATLASAAIFIAVLYFGRNVIFPRGLFVFCLIILLVLTLFLHAAFRFLLRKKLRVWRPTRLLIVGADEFAREVAARLQRLSFAPCQVAAYVRLPGQKIAVRDAVIYELGDLSALHRGNGIDEAVMAIHPMQFPQIPSIMKSIEKLSVPARAVVDLGEGIVVRERLFQVGRMQMLDLTTTPADLLDYVLLKRVFDVCFTTILLILTAPLWGLITVLVWMSSPGPIFFVQERVGLNGLPFSMYKFRTMRVSDSAESDTRWTTSEDSRRTLVGSFLRKTSLDELPQFINVLRGDMSIVGPRPERPHFVHQFLEDVDRYNTRHCLRVGITGWAQVNGWRGDTSIEKRIEYDLYYLQNWSFGFDLRIIVMTVFSVLIAKNAY